MPWTKEQKRLKHNEYMRQWKKEHKDYVNALAKKYRDENQDRWLQWHNITSARVKAAAIIKLGGRCRRCGETNPLLLTLNHINNDGFKDKNLATETMYRQVLRGARDDLELLCWNCQKMYDYDTGRVSQVRADLFLKALRDLGWSW